MFLRLLFLMTFIPVAEIYFLLKLSDTIGGSKTFLIILATGVVGAWLLKKQGASIFQQIQNSTSQSQLPSEAITRGFFTFIGGLLLLTPGLITDVIGMSLIFPLTQILWKKYFMRKWQSGISHGQIHVVTQQTGFGNMEEFIRRQQDSQEPKSPKQMDSTVIDISATKSQTTDKKD